MDCEKSEILNGHKDSIARATIDSIETYQLFDSMDNKISLKL